MEPCQQVHVKSFQKSTINWMIADSSNPERFDFLRRIVDTLPYNELDGVLKLVANCKKRRNRKTTRESKHETARFDPHSSVSAPVSTVSVPEEPENAWFSNYNDSETLSIDVEKVDIPAGKKKNGKPAFVQRAATVAVVDSKYKTVYEAEVFRPFGSYRVTHVSYQKNGITERTLQNPRCLPLKKVQSDLELLMKDKLIVGLSIAGDFAALEIPAQDYNIFDLQWHYYRTFKTPKGKIATEPLGLRSLYSKFYQNDPQPPTTFHTASEDALNTMKIFLEQYKKIQPPPVEMKSLNGTNDICHFGKQ